MGFDQRIGQLKSIATSELVIGKLITLEAALDGVLQEL